MHQKAATKSFNRAVKMAESFHNKSSTSILSLHPSLSDQSLANVKPKTPVCSRNNKEFEVSPFKLLVTDSAIKKKVSMVISRLEDDEDTTPMATTTKGMKTHHVERGLSKDSGFNDAQSDSAGSSEPTFTTIRNRDTTVPSGNVERQSAKSNGVATIVEAQTSNSGEEVHISFDESDGEVDVVTEDVQVENDENNKKAGGGDNNDYVDENNNLNAKAKEETMAKSLNSSTELSTEQVSQKANPCFQNFFASSAYTLLKLCKCLLNNAIKQPDKSLKFIKRDSTGHQYVSFILRPSPFFLCLASSNRPKFLAYFSKKKIVMT